MSVQRKRLVKVYEPLLLPLIVTIVSVDFIRPCQTQSRECLRESLQASLPGFIKGNPALGIEILDHFVVHNLNLTLPGGLVISFHSGVAVGFKKCVIDKARMVRDILEMQFHCNLTIKGKYRSSGRLLMFPIDGDGDSTIRCKNIRLAAVIKLGSRVQNSQKYLEIKNVKVDHGFDGRVFYQMTNLFKGNPEMSKLVLKFMNRNWKMVAEEFGKPIVDYGVASLLRNVEQLFKTVPLNEILSGPVLLSCAVHLPIKFQ